MELTKHRLTLEGCDDEDDDLILRVLTDPRRSHVASISVPTEYIELTAGDVTKLRDALDRCLAEMRGGS